MEHIWSEREVIHSEMIWLESLTRDTDLVVPTPLKNNNNDYITVINGVNCTLLKWVEGEQKQIVPFVTEAGYVGEMIGKLHKHSSSWIVPLSFTRPVFDHSRIIQSLEKLRELALKDELNKNEVEIMAAAGKRALSMMNDIEKSSGNWGIIHADLIPSNFVFHEQEARAIDFGACGVGYFLFDLGWTFSYIHPAFKRHLLETYAKHFELPHNYVEKLEGFFVAAQLETMHF
ncbi:phosphotransferase [Paenibacillus sp. LHD-38]|uniref:phosphotransferase enzyme family protein n=1 Tax=Paenibacillus sp. LHD-38 TaxID=3072143 RepID=UPI00280ED913|nr:phosphotransferase [Paenibacillus sp. LHD-38]MDQ8739313.1 phosphotransferase [Paenibacillus sp. LHD-38]